MTTILGQLDCSGESYSFEDWFRAVTVVFDALCMLDECAMENGVTFLMDAEQVSLKHLKFFGFGNSMRQFSVMQVRFNLFEMQFDTKKMAESTYKLS